ncbi:hypothetical protein L873DRAFT_1320722 [Choiromyces venosus 120613-1]|uniref:Rhodopsin domain-containing protein n=1 Tax=Choiromyces venosus 120613-1 TaxID=1336337 RepID=A0A3N4JAH3_9PEZI|nr:hypothetical protein L873DRAFT_1320722 [Choiromyces venosus 120613-1]
MAFTPQHFGWILTVGIIFFCFVAIRFWVRRNDNLNRFSIASDAFLLTSTIFALATVGYMCYESLHEIEVRRNHPDWKEAQIYHKIFTDRDGLALKFVYFLGLGYMIELWCIKAAFVLFYWNMFSRTQGQKRFALYATSFFIPATFVAVIVTFFTHCRPVAISWDLKLIMKHGRRCTPNTAKSVQWLLSSCNIVTDLMLMAVPLLVIRSFRLTRVDTYAIAFVFLMGVISISATIVRIFYLNGTGVFQPDFRGNITLQQQHNFELISSIEVLAALIAFCLPAFRFLLKVRFVKGGPGISSLSWTSARFRTVGGDRNADSGVYAGNGPEETEETIRGGGRGRGERDLEVGMRGPLRGKEEASTEMIVVKKASSEDEEDEEHVGRETRWIMASRGPL